VTIAKEDVLLGENFKKEEDVDGVAVEVEAPKNNSLNLEMSLKLDLKMF
jgi:hypothetical protein